eukprot:jgi/Ulvmu1/9791/UM056_0031.1
MEPTDPHTQGEGDWSDVEEDVDNGQVEGFDDENWGCDASKGEGDAVGKQKASVIAEPARNAMNPRPGGMASDSVDADVKTAVRDAVDSNGDDTAGTTQHTAASEKWGLGSTFTAFAGALQQDVKEISESMKNAIQHVKEEFQGSPESFHGLEPSRPEGPVALDRSPFDDDDFQQGLEAIDDQVDQIASAAGKALGSFWTGLGGALSTGMQAASNIAGQIETAAVQAANRVSETTKEQWGAHGGGFRSSGGGTLVMPNGGHMEDEWQVVDLLGSPSTSVAASFEQLFKLYRGPRFVDDLEALGNEAARSCNRIRALLPDDKRDELDAIVARTSAFINLIATVPPASDSHSAARALIENTPPSSAPDSAAAAAAKGGPREGLSTMCAAAVQRAGTMGAGVSLATHESAWEGLCRLRAEGLKLLAEFTALSVQHVAFLAMCLEGGDAEAAKLEFSADGKNKGAVVRAVLLQLLSDTEAIYQAFHTALVAATDSEQFAALLPVDAGGAGSSSAAQASVAEVEDEVAAGEEGGSLPAQAPAGAAGEALDRDLAAVAKELKRGMDVGVAAAMDRILQASKHLLYPICAPAAEQLRSQESIFAADQPLAAATGSVDDFANAVSPESSLAPIATTEAGHPESQAVTADDIDISVGSNPAAMGGAAVVTDSGPDVDTTA